MKSDYQDRRELIQRLNTRNIIEADFSDAGRESNAVTTLTLIGIGAVLGLATGAGLVKSCIKDPEPVAVKRDCYGCHNPYAVKHKKLTEYLNKNGVPPHAAPKLAAGILKTKKPKLMAAMAVKESPTGKAGDSGQSKGFYQVKEKHWSHLLTEGKVSSDPVTQTMDSQRILEALVEEKGSLKKGLDAYGGSTTGAYSKMLLAEMKRVNL